MLSSQPQVPVLMLATALVLACIWNAQSVLANPVTPPPPPPDNGQSTTPQAIQAAPEYPQLPPGEFPSGPPKPPPSDVPPPLSPSGRWLHSSVIIDGRMYIYGGVGSYSTALYNDMWVYNFVEKDWFEMQASFVPPFPVIDEKKTKVEEPNEMERMFRPADEPAPPPMQEAPGATLAFAPPKLPADAKPEPVYDSQSIAKAMPSVDAKKLAVTPLQVLPERGSKQNFGIPTANGAAQPAAGAPPAPAAATPPPTGFLEESAEFSFLQESMTSRAQFKAEMVAALEARHSARARSQAETSVVARTQTETQTKMQTRARTRAKLRGTSMQGSMIPGPAGGAKPNEPPRFWKRDRLSPKLMSPFIAADLWEYDLDTKQWMNVRSKSPDVPAPRWLHTAVNIRNQMLIFGGVSYSDIILGDLWVFNPRKFTWTKSRPRGKQILPREGHAAVAVKTDMYVFGGVSYGHTPFNDLWKYRSSGNSWTLLMPRGKTPPPRWLHTMTEYVPTKKGKPVYKLAKIFVFGGVTRGYVPLDDLWIYRIKRKRWSHAKSVSIPPYPRMMHTAAALRGKFMVFGGVANNIPLEDIWVYDMKFKRWDEEHPSSGYPFAREGASLSMVVPPPTKYGNPKRKPWLPPRPVPPGKELEAKYLMPLIKNYTTRLFPVTRFRKYYNHNRFLILFGGAGPKP